MGGGLFIASSLSFYHVFVNPLRFRKGTIYVLDGTHKYIQYIFMVLFVTFFSFLIIFIDLHFPVL